jgi:hypothetical protein
MFLLAAVTTAICFTGGGDNRFLACGGDDRFL